MNKLQKKLDIIYNILIIFVTMFLVFSYDFVPKDLYNKIQGMAIALIYFQTALNSNKQKR